MWHINLGNPELNGGSGWGIFNAILGWTNSATYGSVISYNVYWIAVIVGFLLMRFKETKGYLPFMRSKVGGDSEVCSDRSEGSGVLGQGSRRKEGIVEANEVPSRTISE